MTGYSTDKAIRREVAYVMWMAKCYNLGQENLDDNGEVDVRKLMEATPKLNTTFCKTSYNRGMRCLVCKD